MISSRSSLSCLWCLAPLVPSSPRSSGKPSPANCSCACISDSPCIMFSSISSGRCGCKLLTTAFNGARFVPGVRDTYHLHQQAHCLEPVAVCDTVPDGGRVFLLTPSWPSQMSSSSIVLGWQPVHDIPSRNSKGTQTAWRSHLKTAARLP